MNITNANYFTFNVDNTMFLTGATGSGKSVLQDRVIARLVEAHTPKTLQFVLLDMTSVDFFELRNEHSEFIQKYVAIKSDEALDVLDEMADLSQKRADDSISEPMIFICIEECDMAAVDQPRFDAALMKINKNAKRANMKVIYSTSRPAPTLISKQLLDSFDLVLAGELTSKADANYLGVPVMKSLEQYAFRVLDNNNKAASNG